MADSAETVVITIEGMHCDNCVRKVRTTLEKVSGVLGVEVKLAEKEARVSVAAGAAVPPLLQAVRAAGFTAGGFSRA